MLNSQLQGYLSIVRIYCPFNFAICYLHYKFQNIHFDLDPYQFLKSYKNKSISCIFAFQSMGLTGFDSKEVGL